MSFFPITLFDPVILGGHSVTEDESSEPVQVTVKDNFMVRSAKCGVGAQAIELGQNRVSRFSYEKKHEGFERICEV